MNRAPFKIIPLYDRIIVKSIPPEEQTEGGLFIPQIANNAPFGRGRVLGVGPGAPNSLHGTPTMNVKEGDIVLYALGSAQGVYPIPYPNEPDGTVVIMRESNVVARWENLPSDSGIVGPDGEPVAKTLMEILG